MIVADLADYQALVALASVVIIDVVLAGDNAVVVGMAAAGLPREQQHRVIALGIAMATVLRIGFALVTIELLAIIGLTLAGGILLLWVAWKMYRELHKSPRRAVEASSGGVAAKAKSFNQALLQVVLADVSMSLDNVLAVAGTARDTPSSSDTSFSPLLPDGLPVASAFESRSRALICSQFLNTSAESFAYVSPNTWGCRRIILSWISRITSEIVKRRISCAICE